MRPLTAESLQFTSGCFDAPHGMPPDRGMTIATQRGPFGVARRAIRLATSASAGVRQFAGWVLLGLVAFGAELALLAVLHQWLQYPLWIASAAAAEVVLCGRFLTTDRLVFGHAQPTLQRCWRFHAAAFGSFVVSWLVLNGSATVLDMPYFVAAFLGSACAFIWSAVTNFLWVWRQRPSVTIR